jgi:hypothetical protein
VSGYAIFRSGNLLFVKFIWQKLLRNQTRILAGHFLGVFSRGDPAIVRGVEVGAAGDEKLDHLRLSAVEGAAQRRVAFDVACFQICAGRDQEFGDSDIVAPRRLV